MTIQRLVALWSALAVGAVTSQCQVPSSADLVDVAQARRLIEAGESLLSQNRYAEADKQFEVALAAEPGSAAARLGERKAVVAEALDLRRQGKEEEALRCLEHGRGVLPSDVELLTDLGIEADALRLYSEAAEALDTALRIEPGNLTAEYALARVEVDRDHPQRAEELFRAYLAKRPEDASAHYGLGRLFQVGERRDEAAAEFRRSIELRPVQTEAYYQLGEMALDTGADAEARGEFEKTLNRLPTHGGALTGMGILAYRRKAYTMARERLEAAVASAPEYQRAHYYLGLTLGRLGDAAGSKRELKLAAELTAKQQWKGSPTGTASSQ